MKNYLATVAYNGSEFYGFERQPHLRTIQGNVEKKLSEILGATTLIKGAGRTDRGVHALGQRFSFEAPEIADLPHFVFALNRLLPSDIVIKEIKEVPAGFDARHSSRGKIYLYQFSWGLRDPRLKGIMTQLERPNFDPRRFNEALTYFQGTHDFSNFTTKPADVGGFVRTVSFITPNLDPAGKIGAVTFKADGFMTYMVRLIMGTCFKAGLGMFDPKDIPSLMAKKPRQIVSFKAPPEGLYLVEVLYE